MITVTVLFKTESEVWQPGTSITQKLYKVQASGISAEKAVAVAKKAATAMNVGWSDYSIIEIVERDY